MKDYILRATAGNGSIRAFVAITTETVAEAQKIHNTSPVVSAALGRMLTGVSIMGSMLKNDSDILTINIKGEGPLKGVLVTSDSLSRVKGYVQQNDVDLPLNAKGKLDVSGAIGKGVINVIKDMGLKEPYIGQLPLVSGEIAEDLAYYFTKSEQTPSAVGLGVLVDRDCSIKQAGGFIIQLLPEADESTITTLENNIAAVPPVTELLEAGLTGEEILRRLTEGLDYTINEKIPVSYYCNCNKERVEKALISIGLKDLTEILEQDKRAELHCHFCNKNYFFTESDLRRIVVTLNVPH